MKILIIKTEALGDVLRTSYIAQALKDKYQKNNPEIFWITAKSAEPLFSNNPYVDKVILEDKMNEISSIHFDLIINLEEELKLVRFASYLKNKKFIGFKLSGEKVTPTETAK